MNEQHELTMAEMYERRRFERLPLDKRLEIVVERAVSRVADRIAEFAAIRGIDPGGEE